MLRHSPSPDASPHGSSKTSDAAPCVPQSYLLYDGECPICTRYIAWSALRRIRPDLMVIDARQAPEQVAALRAEGIEINDSMVLQLGALRLSGAQAFAAINQLNHQRPGFTGALLGWLGRPAVAQRLYPLLALGRRLLLALLGRQKIR